MGRCNIHPSGGWPHAHEPRRLADQLPEDEHEAIWKYVEEELLRRRTDTDSIPAAVWAA